MSKNKKSPSKNNKSKSPSKSSGGDRRATEALMLIYRVTAESRLMKRQRAILPRLLRAKVTESFEVISNEMHRTARLEIALVEALVGVFKFKSLKPVELAMVGKIIVGLVRSTAERFPDLVTPLARQTAEAFLGETLEESLQRELREYLDDPQNDHIMEVARAGQFAGELTKARCILDVERAGTSMRRKTYPECVGDLEYFCKEFEPDLESLEDVRKAIELIERRLGQETRALPAGSNVISINSAVGGALTLGAMAGAGDVIGCLEVLISHPSFRTLDRVMEILSEGEQTCLLGGLISQQKILEFEMDLIASHPDFEQIAELIGGFSQLITFDPGIMMEAMTEREVFVTTITTDILRNKSVRAVRALIEDFEAALVDGDEMDDDAAFGAAGDSYDGSETRDWI